MNLKIISAGAGSGKTYRLTSEMVALLASGKVRANGIIATTFTKKAAAELQERVRVRLLEEGLTKEADDLTNALIGTVHGLGVKLLRRFAFEAGVSPQVDIIADEDQQVMFNQSLSTVLTHGRVDAVEKLCDRLGLHKRERFDWRRIVKSLTEVARANDFGKEVLEKSKVLSFETFQAFLPEAPDNEETDFHKKALALLETTIDALKNGQDATKITSTAAKDLQNFLNELRLRDKLYWHQWVKIGKLKVGAKSRDNVAELVDLAKTHEQQPTFQEDIKAFIYNMFDIAIAAIEEFDKYKKSRGLIDYTDMEVLIKELLKNEAVQEVLSEELDLLMVDEFQDTSPIQLEIFLKLSKFAKYSVWVGDPKQSIYGFRGAEPRLMQAIMKKMGGVKPEDIQEHSWRSREDIVYCTNALFTKAFSDLPVEQVALKPKRQKIAIPNKTANQLSEPPEMKDALIHWHLKPDVEGKRLPGKPWMENAIANSLVTMLERGATIFPKGEKAYRHARPGDVAILCKTNKECQVVAEALHRAGLKAAISRSGLLNTAESKLILACLKFILNKYDSLSIAEILFLAGAVSVEEIIEDRLDYIEKLENEQADYKWGEHNEFILQLNALRPQVIELSSAEILTLLLEELDLRRIIVSWGKVQQRLANVDVLCKLSLQYEEACNRLHAAASLGGFLLWLNDLENNDKDMQGSGESVDAVNVLTYHRSKGLEWPIVICNSLEANLRGDVWGLHLVSEKEEVDLDNILGNRWLRYWVNPYADQFRGTPLAERIEESDAKGDALKDALQEEARLLYVGITRARDYLVFPTRPRPTKWLNRVWHAGKEDHPTLDPYNFESPWEWEGKGLQMKLEDFLYPKEFGYAQMPPENIQYIEKASGKKPHKTYLIDLHLESMNGEIGARTTQVFQYASPILLKEDQDRYLVAKVFKAFLTADSTAYKPAERTNMAAAFLDRYEITELLEAKTMLRASSGWFNWLNNQFNIQKIHRKYPIRLHRKGRLFKTIIDLILETDRGLVIIQNSGFAGDQKRWRSKALELGSWLHLSRMAVMEAFTEVQVQTFVHFVLKGALIEVETQSVETF